MGEPIRVKTDAKYKQLYSELTNRVVGDSHELFFITSCLGYNAKKKIALGTKGDQRFWSDTITAKEWSCFRAMMLEEYAYDFSVIQDDKKVLAEIEEYSNGGMHILIDECLKDFIIEKNGLLCVDESSSKELPKHFLYYVFSKLDSPVTA